MALSDDEASSAYSALAKAARECGLPWVLDQVEETIAVGKVTTTRIPPRIQSTFEVDERVALIDEGGERQRASSVFVTSEAYTSTESLALLIDALLLAIPSAHAVATAALVGIGETGRVDSIVFAPDVPNSQIRELRLKDLKPMELAVARLETLLKELRAEL